MKKLILFLASLLTAGVVLAQDPSPYWLRVARGDYDQSVLKHGHNGDVDATPDETAWPYGGTYDWEKANGASTGTTLAITSSSADDTSDGTGARTVYIHGLDENYAEINETVTLNGTSEVASVNTYLRVNGARVETVGSGYVNAGIIYLSETNGLALTDGVPDSGDDIFRTIEIGDGKDHCAMYTIPAGKTGYLLSVICALEAAATQVGSFSIYARPYGLSWRVLLDKGVSAASPALVHFAIPRKLTEKTDIEIRVGAGQADTKIASCFEILLVDD